MTSEVLDLIAFGICVAGMSFTFWVLLCSEKTLKGIDELNDDTEEKLRRTAALIEETERINQETAEILNRAREILDRQQKEKL